MTAQEAPAVAPDFMTKRNSELVDIRDGAPHDTELPRLAMSRSSECPAEMPRFRSGAKLQSYGADD